MTEPSDKEIQTEKRVASLEARVARLENAIASMPRQIQEEIRMAITRSMKVR